MKWQPLNVVWPRPSSTAWRSVVGMLQKPHAVNFTGPLLVSAISIPAMNCPLTNDNPAWSWTLSDPHRGRPDVRTALGEHALGAPALVFTNWNPIW